MVRSPYELKEEVEEALSIVREGDIIEVHFVDACRVRNVRKLINKAYATYKKVIGRFWCIKLDKLYGAEFLIMWDTLTDFERRDIISIPLCTVYKITIHNSGVRVKEMSDVGMPMLVGGYAKPAFRENGIGEEVNE